MDVRNCKSCGKMFNYITGAPICPACNSEVEKKFQRVKEYVQENKSVPLSKIAEDNEVTVSQIKRWVREERLIFSEDSMVTIECENCGKSIRTGRFCDRCKEELHSGFTESISPKIQPNQPKKKSNSARMRFLDQD